MRLIDRYLVQQILGVFGLSLLLFTLVAFFSDALMDFLKDMQRYGIPPQRAFKLLALQVPAAMAFALPASLFLAVLLAYNNLNNHFELIALRVNGASLARLVLPVVVMGLLVTGANFLLVDRIIPMTAQESDQTKLALLQQGVLPEHRRNITLMDYAANHRLKKMLYVGETERDRFQDVTLIDLSRPDVMQIVQAASGKQQHGEWVFRNANAYTISRDTDLLVYNHVGRLVKQHLFGPTEQLVQLQEKVNLYALGFGDLYTRIQQMKQQGQPIPSKYFVRLWEKLTLPLSCLAIALTAVPLAMAPPRQGSERGFVFALVVLFSFYIIRSVFVSLGQAGFMTLGGWIPFELSLALAAVLPIGVIFSLAAAMMWRKAKVL